MDLQIIPVVDKYLLVVMIFLIVSIGIAFFDPATGFREEPYIPLFYISIAGISIIVVYSSYKDRKQRQKVNRERRRKSKK